MITLGRCTKGPLCTYIHDPRKVAICPAFLQSGDCPAGQRCDLSHDPSSERVPTCLHFSRGRCSKPTCRYSHVHVSPSALICRDFAILGYCSNGAGCPERHVVECPDYASSGKCRRMKCHLPHVDRAGQIRHYATHHVPRRSDRPLPRSVAEEPSDVSSEEDDLDEIDSDDVDSEGLDEDETVVSDPQSTASVAQQHDFIGF